MLTLSLEVLGEMVIAVDNTMEAAPDAALPLRCFPGPKIASHDSVKLYNCITWYLESFSKHGPYNFICHFDTLARWCLNDWFISNSQ